MTLAKYDWELVRVEYVQGKENGNGREWPTLEQLAKEHSIPAPTVRSRAHKDGWSAQRSEFHTALVQKSRERALEVLAEKAAQMDIDAVNLARAMFAMAARKLHQGMQNESMTLVEQERLLRICDSAHRMGRRALGVDRTD